MFRNFLLVFCAFLGVNYLSSCQNEEFLTSSGAKLSFSVDTLSFDTVFTSIGSTTKILMVYNKNDKPVKISRIALYNRNLDSPFTLNIDGLKSNSASNIEIGAKDSLYIFVQVLVDPNNSSNQIVELDSIDFELNGNKQNVKLEAIGQNVHLINNESVKTQTWTNDKPYLIYPNLRVDSGQTLTINPGVQIYLHRNASIEVLGSLNVRGTLEKPVVFQGDRLEDFYRDIPGQWGAIALVYPSKENVIDHAIIKNASAAFQIGNCYDTENPSLTITNSTIINNSFCAFYSFGGSIKGSNLVVANAGYYLLGAFVGGSYEFDHCTFYNEGVYFSTRTTPSVYLQDYFTANIQDENGNVGTYTFTGTFSKANFSNCIVYGTRDAEFASLSLKNSDLNYLFDNCILRMPYNYSFTNTTHYKNVKSVNPLLVFEKQSADKENIDIDKWSFALDTLSPAKDAGDLNIATRVPFDYWGFSRLSDGKPDLGAFERRE
jgi:hypothetical protein